LNAVFIKDAPSLQQTMFVIANDNCNMSEHTNRRHNLLTLYTAFVSDAQKADPAASLAGLDKAFAARIQIANSSFSSYKSGARPMGGRIARQIESLLSLERGWMDLAHTDNPQPEQDAELHRFLKLATRAFRRATPAQRAMLHNVLQLSLEN